MKDLLERKIKEIIVEYPPVAAILEGYNIGCTTCSAGDCKLREIVEVHNLSQDDEFALFSKIATVVFPGRSVEIPKTERDIGNVPRRAKLSPPVQKLVDEHVHILKVVAWAGNLDDSVNLAKEKGRLLQAVDFIKGYADAYHHAKEEDILFKQTAQAPDIIAVMLKEHDIGRGHIRDALDAIEKNNGAGAARELRAWSSLLREHIMKEDEILFPWIDRHLTDSEVGRLFGAFQEVEGKFGAKPGAFEGFAAGL